MLASKITALALALCLFTTSSLACAPERKAVQAVFNAGFVPVTTMTTNGMKVTLFGNQYGEVIVGFDNGQACILAKGIDLQIMIERTL